jgi:hypothetical protein
MNKYYLFTAIIFISFISACSPSKESMTLEKYNQAINKGNIEDVIVTLEQLAVIDNTEYQKILTEAKLAKNQLNKALQSFNENDFSTAYLASHASYRKLPLIENKRLLVLTGEKLIPLLQAQLKIEESFKLTPKVIKNKLEMFQKKPADEWDLIEVNQFIENINDSVKLLEDSLNLLNNIIDSQKEPELLNWKADIEQYLLVMIKAKNNLINLAQNTSANILLTLNNQLTEESENMLSLIRPSLAKQSLLPTFLKAQEAYATYHVVIENISLSDSPFQKSIHSTWYKEWLEIENNVLYTDENFQNYPSNSVARVKQLNFYINRYIESNSPPEFKYTNANELIKNHNKIQLILENLDVDKTIISYGLAKS